MKSIQITYDAKVKIGDNYERGEACTQLDFLDDKVVENLIADLNAASDEQSINWFRLLVLLSNLNELQGRIFVHDTIKMIQVVAEIPN